MHPLARKGMIFMTLGILALSVSIGGAEQHESAGPPPARVVTAEAEVGSFAPEVEFVGTVYYREVSTVASEVEGTAEAVFFEEGMRVKEGEPLVRLGSDILDKRLQGTGATHEQVLADLERAKIEFTRVESLFREESVAEQAYDDQRFQVRALEKKAQSLEAEVGRLEVELTKKTIRAPFAGVVLQRHVDRGEWISEGATVATIAEYDVVDITVDIPEGIIPFVRPGRNVRILAGARELSGRVFSIIPKGDIATRTFPVKIRLKNPGFLKEGMEARVWLPSDEQRKSVMVLRDAVIPHFGENVVFAVVESAARMIAVKVVGYSGEHAAVQAKGLEEGTAIVIKGHERLRDGQPVTMK